MNRLVATSGLLIILATLICIPLRAQKACNHTINLSTNVFDGTNVVPGDTICITGGQRDYLLLRNITGTSSQPVVLVNRGGVSVINTSHFYGIKISNCKHIKLIGTTSAAQPYGIRIVRVGNGGGISVDDMSTNVEIAHIEIANTALAGIYAKTDPDCSFVATRDKFTMFNLIIRNCYLHDIEDEGLYIGSSKFTGQYLPACDTTVLPHFIHGVHVFNNIVERTGWDGIQVASAPVDCRIYGNFIRNDSYRETPNQMSGILIGGGSKCDCFNNQIFDGKGDGIDAFGFGTQKIYNNLIVRAGRTYFPNDPSYPRHGIFVGNSPDGAAAIYHIMHNSIISAKSTGIRFANNNTSNNLIFNNIITNPGDFGTVGSNAYFQNTSASVLFNIRNNHFSERIDTLRFRNPAQDNYDLFANSPSINKGFDAGLNAVNFDLLNRPRPHNQGYDIGAFECQDINADLSESGKEKIVLKCFNAERGMTIRVTGHVSGPASVSIFDISGRKLMDFPIWLQAGETTELTVDMQAYGRGVYLVNLSHKETTETLRFLFQ
ncbi:MAG TPA: right-handed parallel beta-helix repeat-containing protein [Bacteroidales bacterium]|nr:right-handed parallel beta-helix repeat-containing protein [Bacteroidales bacterium]